MSVTELLTKATGIPDTCLYCLYLAYFRRLAFMRDYGHKRAQFSIGISHLQRIYKLTVTIFRST